MNERRARILAAARQLFLEGGAAALTMDELSHELGMSKKTVYLEYRDKTRLLEALVDDFFAELRSKLAGALAATDASAGSRIARFLTVATEHLGSIRGPQHSLRASSPLIWARVVQRRREVILVPLARLLEEGRAAGEVRDDLPLDVVTPFVLGGLERLSDTDVLELTGRSAGAAFQTALRVVLEGMLTPQGRQTRADYPRGARVSGREALEAFEARAHDSAPTVASRSGARRVQRPRQARIRRAK